MGNIFSSNTGVPTGESDSEQNNGKSLVAEVDSPCELVDEDLYRGSLCEKTPIKVASLKLQVDSIFTYLKLREVDKASFIYKHSTLTHGQKMQVRYFW